ncbi:MAG: hypothetical protein JW720_10305 [Sedimentisphaerales bacterium]|nr:hypothetical protein [Sedimentisphaerales bacterium]
MKMEIIPKPTLALAFALSLVLTTASISDDIWFSCWDCPYQCHGDADCAAEGGMMGMYRVYIHDLEIIMSVWSGKSWPAYYPGDWNYNPCADFDRDLDVDDTDVAILEFWLGRTDVPADCPGRPPDPIVLDPIPEEFLLGGFWYTITWQDNRDGGCSAHSYRLFYSTNGGDDWLEVDANAIDNTCRYDWFVPIVTSDQCLLAVYDADDANVTDTLDEYFTILECSPYAPITLKSPTAGQSVLADSDFTITWSDCRSGDDCTGSYKLYYQIDYGDWLPVDTNSVDAACSYDWHVPSVSSDQSLLRIEDAGNPDLANVSYPFHIYECSQTIVGDLDGSCYVDFRDYAGLASTMPPEPDFRLISEIADHWCECGNPHDPACTP